MQGEEVRFASVVIPSPLKEPLTYAIPPLLRNGLKIGMRVLVPLGKRKVTGVVVDLLSETPLSEVKEIIECIDDEPALDTSLLNLSRWVSQYYLSPIGEAMATILPPGLRSKSEGIVLLRSKDVTPTAALERKILNELEKKRSRVMSVKALARSFQTGAIYRALDHLARLGAVELRERQAKRQGKEKVETQSVGGEIIKDCKGHSLTAEQQRALGALQERLQKGGFETFLLYGVTGSGKTEIYLRAMEEVRRHCRRSLILTPEISLTPQLLDRLRARFSDRIGVVHSRLAPAERSAQWWNVRRGHVDVVVGARSAVFAPVPELGLIVVDEEHDPSYKQEEGLRYQARDLAVMRGKLTGCPVLLGSATPSVESFENCRQGRYRLLELTQRVEQRPLPSVEIVDVKAAQDAGPKPLTVFSNRLRQALLENYARGQQSLIFLNRRGFANFLQCQLCGFVLRCSQCSVSMTYHLKQRRVFCHHCGFRKPALHLCPACGNTSLSGIGFGTEQVEEELSQLLPASRIARMDRDTTTHRGSQERLIRQWEKREIDLLVGTQMITKGHDVTGVTLVGAVRADLSLNIPDFRAAERTFQLLSQVAGRAGRGKEPGHVIIQTYAPEHYTFRYVKDHDYKGFFASEIEFRSALRYPPFSRLIHLRLQGPKPQQVEAQAKKLGEELRRRQQQDDRIRTQLEILGPAPAPIERLRGRYRWQILLKGEKTSAILEFARQAREILPRSRHTRLYIDVDPYNML